MAKFLSHPKFRGVDSNGDPLSGGKLYTYVPGTTTNKASYPTLADAAAGTNANANPVILDSRGEANVVLIGNTKLKLDTSADVNVWTVDNVNEDYDVLDANGNQLVAYTVTASAVNHLGIANGATGTGPTLSAVGDDSNIDLLIQPKGTGVVTVLGTSTASAEIRLREDTDNGTNYVGLKAPASVTANRTVTLPDEDITLAISTQANLEAEDATGFVQPNRLKYSPGVAKAWLLLDVNATPDTIIANYNVASVVDNATGDKTFTFTTAFSSVNYIGVATVRRDAAASTSVTTATEAATATYTKSTTQFRIITVRGDTDAAADPYAIYAVFFGDQ